MSQQDNKEVEMSPPNLELKCHVMLDERDVHILKPLLEKQLKKVAKFAQQERNHFGSGYAFDELEKYMRLMFGEMDAFLKFPHIEKETKERMKRINKSEADKIRS